MEILEIRDLYKNYGSVRAVNGLSLKVKEGICFGLLGPNGAGKSTTIEIAEGIREPSSGEILFRGEPRDKSYKDKVGIQFQSTALQDHMTVKEALETFEKLYVKTTPIEELVEICNLKEFYHQDHSNLSGGQRQRLLLALALINDPELIFLDEPTTGLDPQNRKNFWDLVNNIKKKNKTIILTTHYMDEAYVLCDEIVIVDKGQIIAQGSPRQLLDKHFKGVKVILSDGTEINTENVKTTLQDLIAKDVSLENMQVRTATLEDLFIDLTGHELRS